jgi:hypothetical protein
MGELSLLHHSSPITARSVYKKKEFIMAIVLILPAFMLLTLAAVAIFSLDKPPIKEALVSHSSLTIEEKFELAA